MVLARVVGTVVSSHKARKIDGIKFLLLEKIDPVSMNGKGDFVVSMDSVGAGVGEIVFYVSGSSARYTDVTEGKPSDSAVVAIVDFIEKDGVYTYQKSGN
jgi:microcompartment protein CcmK/EutM